MEMGIIRNLIVFCLLLAVILLLSGCNALVSPTEAPTALPAQTGEANATPASTVKIPNLAGTDEESAKTALLAKGLIPIVRYEESDSVQEGVVIRTEPGPGSKAEEDTKVTIVVAVKPSTPTPTPPPTPTPEPTPVAIPQGQLYLRDGNYVYFGSYPQSEVTDQSLKTALTSIAGPTSDWTSYDYYINGQASDFMVYKDVSYEGEKYRGVFFSEYRPSETIYGAHYFQEENDYYTNTIYWFRFEPVKWRILSESKGYVFLLSELILDVQDYHYSEDRITYDKSHIREWLNNNFCDTAFTSEEKNIIKTTVVDNSYNSGRDYHLALADDATYDTDCPDTNDKVFLLSYNDATNSNYGFKNFEKKDSSRIKTQTAYAKAQGAQKGYDCWWIRNPFFAERAEYISDGGLYNNQPVYFTRGGVVPALHLAISND